MTLPSLRSDAPAFWALAGTLLFVLAAALPGTRFIQDSAFYLPFHTALESFSVLVALMIFILTWLCRSDRAGADLLLGCGFLAVGLIDFGHALSYPGMPVFVTPSGAEKAIDFWLAARLGAAVTLLAAGLALADRRPRGDRFAVPGLLAALATTAAVYWIVLGHADLLPRTFVAGQGLTPLKIAAEATIVALTLAAAWVYWRRYRATGAITTGYLAAAAWTIGLGELFFTVYANVTDLYNLLGHLFKVLGYALIFRALVVRLIREPRHQAEQAAARAQALIDTSNEGIYLIGEDGRLVECNAAFAAMLGRPMAGMPGLHISDWNPRILNGDPEGTVFERFFGRRQIVQTRQMRADGSEYEAEVAICGVLLDDRRLLLCLSRDITARKRAEALETLSRAFTHSHLGMLITDAEERIIDVNPAFTRLTGYARAEIQGQTPRLLKSGAHDRAFYQAMWQALEGPGHWQGEIRNRAKDGRLYDELITISRVDDAAGRPSHYVAVFNDNTERKRVEEALRKSELELKTIIESEPECVKLLDAEARLLLMNRSGLAMIDADDPAQVLGRPVLGIIDPAYREPFMALTRRVFAGESGNLEFEITGLKGRHLWLETHAVPLRGVDGGIRALLGITRDITERKRAEAELRQYRDHLERLVEQRTAELAKQRGQLQIILNNIPGVVGYWSTDLRLQFANPEALAWIGKTEPEALGRHYAEVFNEADLAENRPFIEGVLRGERQCFTRAYAVPGQPGRVRHAEVHYIPDQQDGALVGFFVLAFDISEITRARDAAEAASRAKSTFLANMSHELRTPMNAIMGLTGLALRRAEDAKLRDQLGKIEQASQHLLSVINDILDLSKIEAERLVLEQVDFRLGEVLENLVSLLGHKAEAKGLALAVETTAPTARLALRGDPLRLGQILLNLTGNAVKFTAAGSITVRARVVEDAADGCLLRFEVADTGIGIGAEDQKRLFTAFEQADGSMTRKYGGTGLGLAISKRLAEMMAGEIGVDSRPGQGSTFWFTARLARAPWRAEAAAEAATATAEARLRARHAGARILLAEDEPINQEVSRSLLEDAGLAVDLAGDGTEAVTMAEGERYDLILMDIQMPHLNGLDATRAIRAGLTNAGTPILAMTANAFAEDRRTCLDAGMNDHIAKPIDPERLYATLLTWLDQVQPY